MLNFLLLNQISANDRKTSSPVLINVRYIKQIQNTGHKVPLGHIVFHPSGEMWTKETMDVIGRLLNEFE